MPVSAEKWFEGVGFEVNFWQAWMKEKGGPRAADYRANLDPNKPFDRMVEAAIRDTGAREIEVLDVGSGPVTGLGYASEKFDIKITAVDPLADAYSILWQEAGETPPVKTEKCFGENLMKHFARRRFHVCHSSNALDHTMDPRTILRAMAQLLYPNGLLYVRVFKNEGLNANYSGLHNWNFDKDDNNNFILWREAERYKINEELSDLLEGQRLTELAPNPDSALIFVGYRKAT